MPGKIKGLKVELEGETKGLEAAMKDVGKAANDINKELKEVEAGLKFDPSNTVLLAQKQELLAQKIAETKKGLDVLRQAEERVEAMFKAGEIDAGQYRNFRREIEKSESKLVTFEKQVRDVEKAQKDAGKTAGEWGEKLKDAAGKAALASGAAAGAAFSAGFLGAIDVEKATDKLNAQLGATGADAERYGEVAGNLYANAYGDSMEDVTGAVSAVVSSIPGMGDATASELEGMTAKVLDFATAFEVDVPRAAQVAGQMVKAGLAGDATEALDLLTRSMQNVPAAVRDDIMDAVDEYGPFMEDIGLTGEQAMALLVKGAENGAYGIDKTGDALKEFTIRATDMSEASGKAYDILGMDQEEMSRKLLEGGEVGAQAFQDIVDGLVAIEDPVAQSQAALALFGTPLEDLSVQEIPAFLEGLDTAKDSLGDVAGATEELGDTLNDNAATQIEAFKRSVQTAFIEKLAAALPHIQGVFGFLTENAAIFVPLTAALGAFALVIGTVAAAMKVWSVVQVILNATLWASPITWIVLAVVALAAAAYLLIKNWDKVSAFFGKLWDEIKTSFMGSLDAIKGALSAAWTSITSAVKTAWGAIKQFFSDFWPLLLIVFTGGIAAIPVLIYKNWDAIKTKTAEVWDAIKEFLSGIWEAISGAASTVFEGMKKAVVTIWEALKTAVMIVVNGLKSGVTTGFENLVGNIKTILSVIETVVTLPFKAAKIALQLVIDTMKAALKGDFEAIPGLIKDALGDVGSLLISAGKSIMGGLWDGLKSKWQSVKEWFEGLGDKIPGFLQKPLGIHSPSTVFHEIGHNIMQGLFDGMGDQQQRLQDSWAGLTTEVALAGGSRYGAVHTVTAPAAAISGPGGPVYHIASVQVVAPNPRAFWKELEAEVALNARAGGRR